MNEIDPAELPIMDTFVVLKKKKKKDFQPIVM